MYVAALVYLSIQPEHFPWITLIFVTTYIHSSLCVCAFVCLSACTVACIRLHVSSRVVKTARRLFVVDVWLMLVFCGKCPSTLYVSQLMQLACLDPSHGVHFSTWLLLDQFWLWLLSEYMIVYWRKYDEHARVKSLALHSSFSTLSAPISTPHFALWSCWIWVCVDLYSIQMFFCLWVECLPCACIETQNRDSCQSTWKSHVCKCDLGFQAQWITSQA